jgi:hypothetical protein
MTAPVAERDLTAALDAAGLRPCRWPGVYRATVPVPTQERMDAITRATGATEWETHLREEEDGTHWWQTYAAVGSVRVEITADADPRLDVPGGEA